MMVVKDLGQYPLLPISNLEEARLPVSMRGKGGFIMVIDIMHCLKITSDFFLAHVQ
jgi:hypothetical protein